MNIPNISSWYKRTWGWFKSWTLSFKCTIKERLVNNLKYCGEVCTNIPGSNYCSGFSACRSAPAKHKKSVWEQLTVVKLVYLHAHPSAPPLMFCVPPQKASRHLEAIFAIKKQGHRGARLKTGTGDRPNNPKHMQLMFHLICSYILMVEKLIFLYLWLTVSSNTCCIYYFLYLVHLFLHQANFHDKIMKADSFHPECYKKYLKKRRLS